MLLLHDQPRQLLQLHLPDLGRSLEQVPSSDGRNFFPLDFVRHGAEDGGQRVRYGLELGEGGEEVVTSGDQFAGLESIDQLTPLSGEVNQWRC